MLTNSRRVFFNFTQLAESISLKLSTHSHAGWFHSLVHDFTEIKSRNVAIYRGIW